MEIIKQLEQYDSSLTVAEVLNKIKEVQKLADEEEKTIFNELVGDLKNTFLKRIEDSPFFGKTLEVFYIEDVVNYERTTIWDRIFNIKGSVICFYTKGIGLRELSGESSRDSFLEKDLRSMEKITEEQYNNYLSIYEKISKELKEIK